MIGDLLRPDDGGGALARFTRDLTADARTGRLEPVRCRDSEIDRIIDILLRHGKNNPALVGPAGVGKTAIAEGLAQRIAASGVPLVMRDVRLLSLDHVSLLAGTTYRGQYEERIRTLVAETTAARDVILFIDELHNLIGQGTAMGAAMDAANMLKPALVRGDFRVIGATTGDEYDRWILGDPALERRFQKLVVRELGEAEALEILRARRPRLERHHNVVIADEALVAAVMLTDAHVRDRLRPDKALDALDEACAHLQAVVVYSPLAEELIKRAREIARGSRDRGAGTREWASSYSDSDRRAQEAKRNGDSSRNAARDAGGSADGESRDPFDALERFGAELEAIFTGPPRDRAAPAPRSVGATAHHGAAPPSAASDALTVQLRAELETQGVIVGGADVARVVGLMSGHSVAWQAPSPNGDAGERASAIGEAGEGRGEHTAGAKA